MEHGAWHGSCSRSATISTKPAGPHNVQEQSGRYVRSKAEELVQFGNGIDTRKQPFQWDLDLSEVKSS